MGEGELLKSYLDYSDVPYEEEIMRNPYSVKSWLRYIDFKTNTKNGYNVVRLLYERSLKQLTGSYKLWYHYLKSVRLNAKKYNLCHTIYEEANNIHERALNPMHKMPRIWIDYLSFLKFQGFITQFRRTFDRSLRSLPSTQHKRIWVIGLEFIHMHCNRVEETTLRMYRRYIELAPEETEDFVDFLIERDRIDEASQKLVEILNSEHFSSKYNKSNFELWQKLCNLITKNPNKIQSLNVDAILRQGISRYKDQVGVLWNCLSDYYIRSNNFGHAIDIYEEAMTSVDTVADFKQIFQAYSDFYQTIIKSTVELYVHESKEELDLDLSILIDKYENLINRRALLLNSVVLKQNPHNVANWLKRVKLHEENGPNAQFETFREAIANIEVDKVIEGRISEIWKEMAWLYLKYDKVEDARNVFNEAVKRKFDKVEDLADIYCARVEMEVKLNNIHEGISILQRATVLPDKRVQYKDKNLTVQQRVHKSLKIWCLYADLIAVVASIDEVKQVYDTIIDLAIATPQIIINYASILEENNYFEQAFSVYQKGVSIFSWPRVYDLWLNYIRKFVQRYESKHFERGNELFSSCLEHCPTEHSKEFYLMYAKYVEDYGSSKKALDIYKRAAMSAKPENRYELFVLLIEKVKIFCGITATRSIYELAIENLLDNDTKKICIRFAEMETQLGEVDRARTIYSHCSQFCDPRITEQEFWMKWKDFETKFGNGENLANMNLIKRSVEAKYNTHQNLINVHLNKSNVLSEDSMQNLEANLQKVPNPISFVSGSTIFNPDSEILENPEALNVEMEDSDNDNDEDEDDDMPRELPVPDEVFGNLV